jgi:hypothetical protein
MVAEAMSQQPLGRDVPLVWEAVAGTILILWGLFTAVGNLMRHRWCGRLAAEDNVYRTAGIIFGVCLSLAGTYLVTLARRGYVAEKGGNIVRYR